VLKKVVLVEPPGLQLLLDSVPLNPLLLQYPKYAQLVLAANLMGSLKDGVLLCCVDLKGTAHTRDVGAVTYKSLIYEGGHLDCQRVGRPFDALEAEVSDASVVAVSCNYSMERQTSVQLIQHVRCVAPSALIVVGGHDTTVAPLPYLHAGADICVLGEGESALAEICSAKDMREVRALPGVAYLTGGLLVRNTKRRRIHNLDLLHYPTEEMLTQHSSTEYPDGPWPPGVVSSYAVLETSRGCDEACHFCSSTFVTGRYRSWSVDGVLRQLDRVQRAGIHTLLIADDNLLYRTTPRYGGSNGRDELLRLFTALRERGFAWTFYNGIQFGLLQQGGAVDEDLVEALFANAVRRDRYIGCFEAYLPLERFGEDDIRELRKLEDPSTQRRIIAAICARKVHQLNLGFIIGTPDDSLLTLDHAERSVRELGSFIYSQSNDTTRVRYLPWCSVPLPGTPNAKRYQPHIRYDVDVRAILTRHVHRILTHPS
jgi:radical SAM superfamily enzyme YgiQ (UPF0313 family)